MLYACRSISLNLLEIPSGAMADSWGRRGCMIVSFSAYIVSFLLFALAPHWLWFFPAMIMYGVGDSFRTGTHKAMIFEWLRLQGRSDDRTRVYGVTRSWSKFGSAVSAILAAIFVLITGDYRKIFLFATIPYVLNIINFLGYPKELDGLQANDAIRRPIGRVIRETVATLKSMFHMPSLRRLTFESMAWEGVLHAIKDYLQPALAAVVLFSSLNVAESDSSIDASTENPAVVIVIAAAYTLLFLLSGWASRSAHRVVTATGSESAAAHRLWIWNVGCYAAFILCDLSGWPTLVAAILIALIVMQNIWRPILISRFDQHADPARGATVLSIESQSQRLATFFVAPIVGWTIDQVASSSGPGQFWPIGVVGAAAALLVLLTGTSHSGKA